MMKIGYIRVSSIDQNVDRQMIEMEKLKVGKIFQEMSAGKTLTVQNFKNYNHRIAD